MLGLVTIPSLAKLWVVLVKERGGEEKPHDTDTKASDVMLLHLLPGNLHEHPS